MPRFGHHFLIIPPSLPLISIIIGANLDCTDGFASHIYTKWLPAPSVCLLWNLWNLVLILIDAAENPQEIQQANHCEDQSICRELADFVVRSCRWIGWMDSFPLSLPTTAS